MNRFKIIDSIDQHEAKLGTMETRWKKLNAICQTAWEIGIAPEEEDTEIVRERWIKMKRSYATR